MVTFFEELAKQKAEDSSIFMKLISRKSVNEAEEHSRQGWYGPDILKFEIC